ncbi:MAG TPA: lipase maturation factor family protein [Terriglobales bacterium]|nr:lipase maturation factor family protein [Terriglobales bacterium]
MSDSLDRPMLVFDGECSFCRVWIEYWRQLTGERVLYTSYQEIGQEIGNRFPDLPRKDRASAVTLLLPSGEVRSGAHAVFSLLALLPGKSWMLWLYVHIPGFALIADLAYRVVARHRSFCHWATRALWEIPIEVGTFGIASWLFLRTLGAVYLVAFASFAVQAAGLIGSHGISPVAEFLHSLREYYGAVYWQVPTVFWLNAGDGMIKAVGIAGICLSLLLFLGVRWRIIRVALFVLYLSLVTAGQEFMGYQWDALLLEAGFLSILLGFSPVIPWLYRWLLFRLVFLSGAVKLASGDPSWRYFTALPVHYETQPLPTPLAWYIYQFPAWFQRGSVRFVFFVELVVPFLIFAPRRIRFLAARAIIVLQVLILLTGNYAFFNVLTIGFCLFLVDDAFFRRVLPKSISRLASSATTYERSRVWSRAVCGAFAALALFVGSFQVARAFGVRWSLADVAIRSVSPFEIINSYGLFAVMTTTRPEIVIEGSNDGVTWLPYEFKYKPGDLTRRPGWVAPHQPRLDWQMWFAALGDYQSDPWIVRFMARLLQGSPEVLQLLGRNPFPDGPPHYVRAMLYQYRFTSPAERKNTGAWWSRELKGVYVPAVSLRN